MSAARAAAARISGPGNLVVTIHRFPRQDKGLRGDLPSPTLSGSGLGGRQSDLLVVNDAVALPGTVIMFHHVCDRQPTALPLLTLHHELHGYEHFTTLSACKGARGVNRNADEQSALLPPLLSRPTRGSAQSACTYDADRRSSVGALQSAEGRLPGAKIGREARSWRDQPRPGPACGSVPFPDASRPAADEPVRPSRRPLARHPPNVPVRPGHRRPPMIAAVPPAWPECPTVRVGARPRWRRELGKARAGIPGAPSLG